MGRGRALLAPMCVALVLAGCYRDQDYDLTAARVNDYLSLAVDGAVTSLPADGFSRVRVVAQISPMANSRTIVFSTSNGMLIGGTQTTTPAGISLEADSTGRAVVELQSSDTVETARVRAQIASGVKDGTALLVTGLVQEVLISFVPVDPNDIIRFVRAPGSAPADGATLSSFSVLISASLPTSKRTVRFTTTVGTTLPSGTSVDVPADASNVATVDLMSPNEIGSARVKATVANVTREAAISFERAFPDYITVVSEGATVADGGNVTVTVTLLRDIGKVSPNTVVKLAAVRNDNGASLGSFRNVERSSSAGTATADYSPGTTPYRGIVTIQAGTDGTSARGSTTVKVVD